VGHGCYSFKECYEFQGNGKVGLFQDPFFKKRFLFVYGSCKNISTPLIAVISIYTRWTQNTLRLQEALVLPDPFNVSELI